MEKPDGETLGSSILCTSRLHPRPMPFTPPRCARKITSEHLKTRRIDEWDYGELDVDRGPRDLNDTPHYRAANHFDNLFRM